VLSLLQDVLGLRITTAPRNQFKVLSVAGPCSSKPLSDEDGGRASYELLETLTPLLKMGFLKTPVSDDSLSTLPNLSDFI